LFFDPSALLLGSGWGTNKDQAVATAAREVAAGHKTCQDDRKDLAGKKLQTAQFAQPHEKVFGWKTSA